MINDVLEIKSSKEWIEFENYYNSSNFLQQIDFFRYEDVNTNFLASLLKSDNVYQLGDYPIRLLIEMLKCKDNNCFKDVDLLETNDITDIDVLTQKVIDSGKLDLFIQFNLNDKPYAIILEAKLFSTEHDEQCRKYKEELDLSLKNIHEIVYVYLSLENKTHISSDDYIRITYQDMIDKLYIPCSFKIQNKEMTLSIEEYMKSFTSLYKLDDIDDTLIPITYTGKELTINLWIKHRQALQSLLANTKTFKTFYNNNRMIMNILLTNLLKLGQELDIDNVTRQNIMTIQNNSKHKNYFNKPLSNSDFLYEVFKDIITNHNIQSLEDIPVDIVITTGTWRNIIPSSQIEYEPRKDYYRLSKGNKEPITIADEQYWYCDWNNGDDIERFIEAVKKHYPEYEDKIFRIN